MLVSIQRLISYIQRDKFLKPSQHLAQLTYIPYQKEKHAMRSLVCLAISAHVRRPKSRKLSDFQCYLVEIYILKHINKISSSNKENHNNDDV